jgi:hypothetical protein
LTDKIGLGNDHILEKYLAKRRAAIDQLDRLGFYTRRAHVDQNEADATLLARPVGADQAETPVCKVRAACPDLLAVNQEAIAPILGEALQ